MRIVGIVLIVIGLISLALGGISYTTKEKVVDIGPIEATAERHRTIPTIRIPHYASARLLPLSLPGPFAFAPFLFPFPFSLLPFLRPELTP